MLETTTRIGQDIFTHVNEDPADAVTLGNAFGRTLLALSKSMPEWDDSLVDAKQLCEVMLNTAGIDGLTITINSEK